MIGVPMLFGNEVKGVLYLNDEIEHDYSETEISLLQTLVGQATIAVNNAKSYKEINNQREFLKVLIDTIPTPIFYIDKKERRYIECNDEYARIMSYSTKSDIVGKSLNELYNTRRVDLFERRDSELFDNPTIQQSFEDKFVLSGKETIYKTLKKCIFNRKGEVIGIIGVLLDITDEKEKFEYKKSLLSDIEHEYKTPLAVIKSSIDNLEDYLTDADDKIQNHIVKIKKNIEASIQLFEEYVKFQPMPSNLYNEIREIIKEMEARQKISQEIRIDCTNRTKKMSLDSRLIKTIIENLVSNAIKYSKKKNDVISISINYTINEAIITIEDQGIGIPEGSNDKIFEYTYRGTNVGRRKGSGTGLAIVKQRVLLHEGTIQYYSKENEGTIFTINLPINKSE
ncbi:MAG: PAS domain-containing protein [Chloroflexia bacterium]|nr:PAS domain-containing protein [Chloroflexia bacterium]